MTRVLHTADWHLGARLVEHERTEEHRRFLDWLLACVRREKPDVLLIAGDVFDTSNPPASAIQLYFDFLSQMREAAHTRVIVTGGNHDSPQTLNAPSGLLRRLDVHVHGCPPEHLDNCLSDYDDVVVCAVPFLRERDVRTATPGQSSEQIAAEIRAGITRYYRTVLERARERAAGRAILTSGHLTVVGATTSDSEREIHIGNLGAVGVDCFDGFDYVALGHLHKPQAVGNRSTVRYSGSPVPLSFDDGANAKSVVLIDFVRGEPPRVRTVPLPVFRPLVRVACAPEGLDAALGAVASHPGTLPAWVEVTLEAALPAFELERKVRETADAHGVCVLKCALTRVGEDHTLDLGAGPEKSLADMAPAAVFLERLRSAGIDPQSDEGGLLAHTFLELLSRHSAAEREARAELAAR